MSAARQISRSSLLVLSRSVQSKSANFKPALSATQSNPINNLQPVHNDIQAKRMREIQRRERLAGHARTQSPLCMHI
eukprot:Awhi_evm1s9260